MPDSTLNPPPSKIGRLLFGDALKQLLESVPMLSGDVAAIAGSLSIGLVCAKHGPA
jgi:hypothetical protein